MTDTAGLTSTPAEKAAKEKAKRDKLITKTLKKDPVKAKFMNNAVNNTTTLKAHLEQGDFDDFLSEVIEEAGEQKLRRQVKAGVPGADKKLAQRTAAGKTRSLSTKGLKDQDYDKAIKDRAAKSKEGTPEATFNAKKESRPARAKILKTGKAMGSAAGSAAASRAEGERDAARQDAKTTASLGASREKAARKEGASTAQRARGNRLNQASQKPRARFNVADTAKVKSKEPEHPAYSDAKKEYESAKQGAKAGLEKSPMKKLSLGRTGAVQRGFRKVTGQGYKDTRAYRTGKKEGEAGLNTMKGRLKGVEGGMIRRGLRKVTGREEKFQRRLAQYGKPGQGGTAAQPQQHKPGIPSGAGDAEKRQSVLQQKVATECVRGQFDLLIPEVRTRR